MPRMPVRFQSGTRIGQKRVRKLSDAHPIKFMIPRQQYEALEKLSAKTGESKAHWVRHAIRLLMMSEHCVAFVIFTSCARTDFYYPGGGGKEVVDQNGHVSRPHGRAIVFNGRDSLGATHVRITSNSLEFSNQGGIDNSTSTREGYRTVRHGVGTAATMAVLGIAAGQAASAYSANQAASATSNAAASKASASIAASKGATTVQLAEIAAQKEAAAAAAAAAAKALPAAGSVIPAQIPATIVPVP